MWTIDTKKLIATVKLGDVLCIMSYGSAKTWGVVTSIKYEFQRDMYNRVVEGKAKRKVLTIKDTYYKSYYDKHLTGRAIGITRISENCGVNYPMKNCTYRGQ